MLTRRFCPSNESKGVIQSGTRSVIVQPTQAALDQALPSMIFITMQSIANNMHEE